ncbi:Ger(x)C family spore germination protein [Paenibacillus jamilae]|uniref:Ger(x)C family spore germination protein n=1 Tax=Paenibacillus TaxID=44249 RepID=UPI00077CD934|nr:Ger(x)C family spore germination protein [Paenibacillus polymyxa]KYG94190.1 spore germination protein KC [Paenibacillus polymyxa]MCP3795004.1 Ger(x)C family spore germination protein [Paenibacillus sp. CH40]
MHQGKGNERRTITLKWRVWILSLTGLLLMPLLSGCWDSVELNQRAVVAAIGIDEDGESGYAVSLQVIVADEIAGAKARGATPVVLYQEKGKNLFQAIRRASQRVSRIISLAHTRLVVIGEKLARAGIGDTLDFLERSTEIRLPVKMMVARGNTGKDVLAIMTAIGRIPANDISGKLETSERLYAGDYAVTIDDVIRSMSNKGGGPVLTGIEVDGNLEQAPSKNNVDNILPKAIVHINGMGVFQKDRLVRWLDDEQAIGLSMINNKVKSAQTTLNCGKNGETIGIETLFSATNIHTQMEQGEPVFVINLKQTGAVQEAECPINLQSSEAMKRLQEQWTEETKKVISSTVREVQRTHSDVIGFGLALERSYPKKWEKLSSEWRRYFAESTVRIQVTSVLKHTQSRTNPYSKGESD